MDTSGSKIYSTPEVKKSSESWNPVSKTQLNLSTPAETPQTLETMTYFFRTDDTLNDQENLFSDMTSREVVLHLAEMTDLSCTEVERIWNNISAWYTEESVDDRLHGDLEYLHPNYPRSFERWLIRSWTGDPADMTISEILKELFPFVDSEYRDYLFRSLSDKLELMLTQAGYEKVPTHDDLDWRWV